MAEQSFHFVGVGSRMAATNPRARDLAGHFVQLERDGEAFFTRHLAITLDLLRERGGRSHRSFIAQRLGTDNRSYAFRDLAWAA